MPEAAGVKKQPSKKSVSSGPASNRTKGEAKKGGKGSKKDAKIEPIIIETPGDEEETSSTYAININIGDTLQEDLERLAQENAELKKQVESLTAELRDLKAATPSVELEASAAAETSTSEEAPMTLAPATVEVEAMAETPALEAEEEAGTTEAEPVADDPTPAEEPAGGEASAAPAAEVS
jgi:hypothetical protein